jgi:hypothetical protein
MARGYTEQIFLKNTSGGTGGVVEWAGPVDTFTDLSTVGTPSTTPTPIDGEARVVKDTDKLYIYDATGDSWILVGPGSISGIAEFVTVAKSGGDFTSVKTAVDSITTATSAVPFMVLVYPGVYTESPITVDPYISIMAHHGSVITASDNNSPLFTLQGNQVISGMSVNGPTNDVTFEITAAGTDNTTIQHSKVLAGLTAISVTGLNTVIDVDSFSVSSSVTNGILADTNSQVRLHNYYSEATGNHLLSDNSEIIGDSWTLVGGTNGIYADNGGYIEFSTVSVENTTNVVRTGSTGSNSAVTGNDLVVSGLSRTFDIYQELADGLVELTASKLDASLFSVTDWDNISIDFENIEADNPRYIYAKDVDFGLAEDPNVVAIGEGGTYVRGMNVLTTDGTATSTTDGGNITDISVDAGSDDSSTFTFQGTTANHTILIGSELSDGADALKHWGIFVKQTIAAAEITPKSFSFEYWSGTTWTLFDVMAVQKENHYRYGNEVFIRDTSSPTSITEEYIRFGIGTNEGWAKKTINAKNLYWIRVRINTAVTTAPTFEQFKLIPSYNEINENGLGLFGLTRYKETIFTSGDVFGESGGVVNGSFTVGTTVSPSPGVTTWTHPIKNSLLNTDGDALYFQFILPEGVDTSYPMTMNVTYIVDSDSTGGTSDFGMSLLPAEVTEILEADSTGGIIPVNRTLANTSAVTVSPAQVDIISVDTSAVDSKIRSVEFGPYDISEIYSGDILYMRLEMIDSDGADILVNTVDINTVKWNLGTKVD